MNIIFITTLYPAFPNQSRMEMSYAVHYFAQEYAKQHEVTVIRLFPSYPSLFNAFGKARRAKKILQHEDKFDMDGVSVCRIPIRKYPKIDYFRQDVIEVSKRAIKCLGQDAAPDLVICDILNPSIYVGERISKHFKSKLVASLHNSDKFYLQKNKNRLKFMAIEDHIENIIFRSTVIETTFMKMYKGKKDATAFATVLFGIQDDDLLSEQEFLTKINKPMKEIVVACSLIELKKVNVLISAFSRISSNSDYILRVIGDGPEKMRLMELAVLAGCKDQVIFEGQKSREDVLRCMQNADVFAMVSSPETFGLVYVEAMAKGFITIGSRGEGIDGVIVDGLNGYLCSPDSVVELEQVLKKALQIDIQEKEAILSCARITASEMTYKKLAIELLNKVEIRG